jgi:hypothetical protein
MEALVELHDNIMCSLVAILFTVGLVLVSIIKKSVFGLEWALHNPPKPYAFTSLPLQSSSGPSSKGNNPNNGVPPTNIGDMEEDNWTGYPPPPGREEGSMAFLAIR